MKQFFFIAGMPRSGSTLLSAILRQNPRIEAGMSSPVAQLIGYLIAAMGPSNDYGSLINETQRKRLCEGVFSGFYGDDFDKNIIFDTNRTWCSRLPLLHSLFPKFRLVVCVRDFSEVISSFERLYQANPFLISKVSAFDNAPPLMNTVYTRSERLAADGGTVGFGYCASREAFYSDFSSHLLFVTYNSLVDKSLETLNAVYEFCEIDYFDHDFQDIRYDGGKEFDARLGLPGLHEIRSKVSRQPSKMLLPPDLVARFAGKNFWLQDNPRAVRVI